MSDEGKRSRRKAIRTLLENPYTEPSKWPYLAVEELLEDLDTLSSIPDPAALVEAARRVERAERLWAETPIAIRDCSAGLLRLDELRDAIIALRTALNPEEPHGGD